MHAASPDKCTPRNIEVFSFLNSICTIIFNNILITNPSDNVQCPEKKDVSIAVLSNEA